MKIKKIACAAVLAPIMLLAACGSTPQLTVNTNWYSNTNVGDNITGTKEELLYTVNFVPEDDKADFRAEYDPGKLTMTLTDETISFGGGTSPQHGYHLHTEYEIKGRYYVKNVAGDEFTDFTRSDVWFLPAVSENLRPVRSYKEVQCAVPVTAAKEAKDAENVYHYSYTTDYKETQSATVTYKDFLEENNNAEYVIKLGSGGSYFDNEEILFALRGLDLSAAFTFRTINPITRSRAKISTVSKPTAESVTLTFSLNGVSEERTVDSFNFAIRYGGTNSGRAQNCIYAKRTSASQNTYRNILLRLETYALSSLGTFVYQISEATFNDK